MLQRCREYGVARALIRDVLDHLESLSPAELAGAVQIMPAEDLQAELRRRIDGALDNGDVLAWDHWLTVSIALEQAGGPNPLQVAAPAGTTRDEIERDARWAMQFLAERNPVTQRQMLRDGTRPLPQSVLDQVRLRFRAAHLIAAHERDALEVIHLRRSLAIAQVAAAQDRNLTEEWSRYASLAGAARWPTPPLRRTNPTAPGCRRPYPRMMHSAIRSGAFTTLLSLPPSKRIASE